MDEDISDDSYAYGVTKVNAQEVVKDKLQAYRKNLESQLAEMVRGNKEMQVGER
jgi:hypothetical protein